jgi:acetyl esterase/lipase
MKMKHFIVYLSFGLLMFTGTATAMADDSKRTFKSMGEALTPTEVIPYKQVGDVELNLHVFRPKGSDKADPLPAYVLIHGGGWRSNNAKHFYPYANSLVEHGYVGISVEYRLVNAKQKTTVFDCVKDTRAAIRYIRANADQLGIDPKRIAVGGGSAGAHLAAGTALFQGIDHDDEDLTVSCRPDAIVLLFGVLDTSPEGYGNKLIGEDWQTISPRHQIRKGMPPTLIFHGDQDRVASKPILDAFCDKLKANEVPYELVLEEGGQHGHINNDMALFDDAAERTKAFLASHGFEKIPDR